jgi:Spy/CpxP family protein refolding chaperone
MCTASLVERLPNLRWLLPGVLAVFVAGRVDAQPPSPFVPGPWWRDFQKVLNLKGAQTERIEAIFQTTLPRLRQKRDQLYAEEAELSRLIKADSGEASVASQSDRVEAVRTVLNKERTLMLVHMRAVLTPDQRIKLNVIREQWNRDHPNLRRR